MRNFVIALVSVGLLAAFSLTGHNEAWYRDKLALSLGKGGRVARTEVVVLHGRADVVTREYAIEVDYVKKFQEGLGQCMWYSWQLGKHPGLALIARKDDPKAKAVTAEIMRHSDIKLYLIAEEDGSVKELN